MKMLIFNLNSSLCSEELNIDEKQETYKSYIKYLKKLAYFGDSDAQNELASTFDNVNYLGFEQGNLKKCFFWHKKAADKKMLIHAIGWVYTMKQLQMNKNFKLAEFYYLSAIHGGINLANKNYKDMLRKIEKGTYSKKRH